MYYGSTTPGDLHPWILCVAHQSPMEWSCQGFLGRTNLNLKLLVYMISRSLPTRYCHCYIVKEENKGHVLYPSRGLRIQVPIRAALGVDAYDMVMIDLENIRNTLDELKEISMGVGDVKKKLDTVNFLQMA